LYRWPTLVIDHGPGQTNTDEQRYTNNNQQDNRTGGTQVGIKKHKQGTKDNKQRQKYTEQYI
jgi:hypothetical protein